MNDDTDVRINHLAVEICRDEPDIEAAVAKLKKKLAPHKDEIADMLYDRAVRHAVHDARHQLITKVKASANHADSRTVQASRAGEAAFTRGFLASFTLPDNTRLIDADCEKLTIMAAESEKQAVGFHHRAKFFRIVADHIGAKRVGEALTDEQGKALWRQAQKAIDRQSTTFGG